MGRLSFICVYVVNREIYKDHKNRVQAFHRIYQRRNVFNFGSHGDGFITSASDKSRRVGRSADMFSIKDINSAKFTTRII